MTRRLFRRPIAFIDWLDGAVLHPLPDWFAPIIRYHLCDAVWRAWMWAFSERLAH